MAVTKIGQEASVLTPWRSNLPEQLIEQFVIDQDLHILDVVALDEVHRGGGLKICVVMCFLLRKQKGQSPNE